MKRIPFRQLPIMYEVGENKKQERDENPYVLLYVLRMTKVANGHVLILDLFAPPSKDGGKV